MNECTTFNDNQYSSCWDTCKPKTKNVIMVHPLETRHWDISVLDHLTNRWHAAKMSFFNTLRLHKEEILHDKYFYFWLLLKQTLECRAFTCILTVIWTLLPKNYVLLIWKKTFNALISSDRPQNFYASVCDMNILIPALIRCLTKIVILI